MHAKDDANHFDTFTFKRTDKSMDDQVKNPTRQNLMRQPIRKQGNEPANSKDRSDAATCTDPHKLDSRTNTEFIRLRSTVATMTERQGSAGNMNGIVGGEEGTIMAPRQRPGHSRFLAEAGNQHDETARFYSWVMNGRMDDIDHSRKILFDY